MADWLLVGGYLSLVAGFWLLVTSRWMLITVWRFLIPGIRHLLSGICFAHQQKIYQKYIDNIDINYYLH
jgi:uncharacterized membrane protein HdeD (DUF308 family)